MKHPRKVSRISRKRRVGFRARMKSKSGRKVLNRQRRIGRRFNTT